MFEGNTRACLRARVFARCIRLNARLARFVSAGHCRSQNVILHAPTDMDSEADRGSIDDPISITAPEIRTSDKGHGLVFLPVVVQPEVPESVHVALAPPPPQSQG